MAAPRLPALVAALGAGDAAVTEAAARALSKFAGENNANRVAIAEAGAITPLIKLVRLGSDGAKKAAVAALHYLSFDKANEVAIVEAGAIAPLVGLLSLGSEGAREQAAGALWTLSLNNAAAVAEAGGVAPLEKLVCDDERGAWWASRALKEVAFQASRALEEVRAHATLGERAGVDEYMPERPEEHFCPISLNVMVDPVAAADGITYERADIEKWLQDHDTSPMTNAELPHKKINPNTNLKILIRNWRRQAKSG